MLPGLCMQLGQAKHSGIKSLQEEHIQRTACVVLPEGVMLMLWVMAMTQGVLVAVWLQRGRLAASCGLVKHGDHMCWPSRTCCTNLHAVAFWKAPQHICSIPWFHVCTFAGLFMAAGWHDALCALPSQQSLSYNALCIAGIALCILWWCEQ